MQITRDLSISDDELMITFVHASGPGGQNVNKVSTAVQLRFNIGASPSLPPPVKERLTKLAGSRLTQDSILIIEARRYRSQEQNRIDALQRFQALILKAVTPTKARHATRPSLASRIRRVESKKKRGVIKKQRQLIDD
jgi:ribosome-associated protein